MDAIYAIGIDVILLLILGIGLGQNLSIKLLGVLLLISTLSTMVLKLPDLILRCCLLWELASHPTGHLRSLALRFSGFTSLKSRPPFGGSSP